MTHQPTALPDSRPDNKAAHKTPPFRSVRKGGVSVGKTGAILPKDMQDQSSPCRAASIQTKGEYFLRNSSVTSPSQ